MKTETVESPVSVVLDDGTRLFSRYRRTVVDDIRTFSIDGHEKKINMGRVTLGPVENWVRRPDGREYRANHKIEILKSVASQAQRKPLWVRLYRYLTGKGGSHV